MQFFNKIYTNVIKNVHQISLQIKILLKFNILIYLIEFVALYVSHLFSSKLKQKV